MPLPHGLSTKGQDRSNTASLVLPDKLDGQSVVDIGCCYGYFCYEARRGGVRAGPSASSSTPTGSATRPSSSGRTATRSSW